MALDPDKLPDHAQRNRAEWNRWAPNWVESGRENWASPEMAWGMWRLPESRLRVLPEVAGLDVLELGCGTAYWSGWLARRGARATGLDLSEQQLNTARLLQAEFGVDFPLIHASAEDVPLPDASFDLVLSEYGASIWCDPYAWIPEASRLLRPGGRLIFLVNGVILALTMPDTPEITPAGDQLLRPYFGMHRFEWQTGPEVEFHLPHGELIRLLRANGFEIEDLIELQVPEGTPPSRFDYVMPEWAHRWPSEEIWKARKHS